LLLLYGDGSSSTGEETVGCTVGAGAAAGGVVVTLLLELGELAVLGAAAGETVMLSSETGVSTSMGVTPLWSAAAAAGVSSSVAIFKPVT